MKKTIAFLLSGVMILALAGCSQPAAPAATTAAPTTAAETTAAPAPETTAAPTEAATEAAPKEVITLKVSTTQADGTNVVDGLNALAEAVKEKTDGGLILEVYPGSSLGGEEDLIEQALMGANICVRSDAGRCSNYVYDMGILNMAYFVDNYDEALEVVNSATFKKWEDELAEQGLRVVSFTFSEGFRNFFINKEATKPEDLNGLVIRCPGSDPYVNSIKSLGATPYSLAFSEIYNAMQTKVIDGCEIPVNSAASLYLNEVSKYMIETEHIFLVNCLLCGEEWFQGLPQEYQDALLECGYDVGVENARTEFTLSDANLQTLVDGGMEVIKPDKEAFIAASADAYEELGWTDLRAQIYEEIGKK